MSYEEKRAECFAHAAAYPTGGSAAEKQTWWDTMLTLDEELATIEGEPSA